VYVEATRCSSKKMAYDNQKVLPSKFHWAAVAGLFLFATVSFLTFQGGWILYIFPLLAFMFGRGHQMENEGLKT